MAGSVTQPLSIPGVERTFVAGLLLVSFLIFGCSPDAVDEPVFNTPESAIEKAIAEELGVPVSLRVEVMNQHGKWVFVAGQPLMADRTPIDYSETPFAKDIADGDFEDSFIALVKRSDTERGAWGVVELSVGATDAPFVDWPERYALPRALVMPGSDLD